MDFTLHDTHINISISYCYQPGSRVFLIAIVAGSHGGQEVRVLCSALGLRPQGSYLLCADASSTVMCVATCLHTVTAVRWNVHIPTLALTFVANEEDCFNPIECYLLERFQNCVKKSASLLSCLLHRHHNSYVAVFRSTSGKCIQFVGSMRNSYA